MKKYKILLVEDDEFLHQLYFDLLQSVGYEVTGVKNGNDAYDQMAHHAWDLVLLDVMLPGMNGFTILSTLKEENVTIAYPVVYLTNLDASEKDKHLLELATAYWIKSSLAPPEFLSHVQSMLTPS